MKKRDLPTSWFQLTNGNKLAPQLPRIVAGYDVRDATTMMMCVSFRNKKKRAGVKVDFFVSYRVSSHRYLKCVRQWSSPRACNYNIIHAIWIYWHTWERTLIVPIANFTCFYSINRCAFCLVSCSSKVVSPVKTPNVRYLILIRAMRAFEQSAQRLFLEVFLDSSCS